MRFNPKKKATGKRKASDEPEGSVPKKKTASSEKGKDQKSNSDFSEPTLESDELRITTWNVASYNTICSKGYFDEYLKNENPDILCLNETKVGTVPENKYPGYYSYFYESEKPGYSGVAVITKTKPISIQKGIGDKEHDTEGRCITAEYDNFYLVATYIPNAGAKDKGSSMPKDLEYRMEWDKAFQKFLLGLDKKKTNNLVWRFECSPQRSRSSKPFQKQENSRIYSGRTEFFRKIFRYRFCGCAPTFFSERKRRLYFLAL